MRSWPHFSAGLANAKWNGNKCKWIDEKSRVLLFVYISLDSICASMSSACALNWSRGGGGGAESDRGNKICPKCCNCIIKLMQHHIELFNHMGIQRETVFVEKFCSRKICDFIFSKSDFDISCRAVCKTKSNVIN